MQELTPLEKSERPYFVGIDVGGTNTKIGIVDNNGQTLAYESIPTIEEEGPGGLVTRAGQAVRRMMSDTGIEPSDVRAAGLGTPGPMDIPQGMILDPTNLPHWRFYPIRDRLSEQLTLPVAFTNDANAAAYGEFWVGSGRKYDSMIMLTLGTGVGGGIIVNGYAVEGVNSFGAECGHIIVDSRPTLDSVCGEAAAANWKPMPAPAPSPIGRRSCWTRAAAVDWQNALPGERSYPR